MTTGSIGAVSRFHNVRSQFVPTRNLLLLETIDLAGVNGSAPCGARPWSAPNPQASITSEEPSASMEPAYASRIAQSLSPGRIRSRSAAHVLARIAGPAFGRSQAVSAPAASHAIRTTLRHQLHVVNRSRERRLPLTRADRVLWVFLSKLWGEWRDVLVIGQARDGPGLASPRLPALLE
jgi:hypothetical protein